MDVIKKAVLTFKNNCLDLIDGEIKNTQAITGEGFIGLAKNRVILTLKDLKKNIKSLPTNPKVLLASYNQRLAQRKKLKVSQGR